MISTNYVYDYLKNGLNDYIRSDTEELKYYYRGEIYAYITVLDNDDLITEFLKATKEEFNEIKAKELLAIVNEMA